MPTSPPDSYTEKDKQCGSIATKLGGVQPVAGARHFSAGSAKRCGNSTENLEFGDDYSTAAVWSQSWDGSFLGLIHFLGSCWWTVIPCHLPPLDDGFPKCRTFASSPVETADRDLTTWQNKGVSKNGYRVYGVY